MWLVLVVSFAVILIGASEAEFRLGRKTESARKCRRPAVASLCKKLRLPESKAELKWRQLIIGDAAVCLTESVRCQLSSAG
jgi:hypothetical protein